MKKAIFLLILIGFVFGVTASAQAYWIWSPKTGKWLNPKYVVKPTPGEQLKFAQSFFEKKDYPRALIEFQALIKNYPKAFEAAEAQFSIGTCLENMNKPYEAYLAYQKMIDKYPFSDKINDAIKKEFDIADQFISGKKRKFAGIPLPVENPAIEILRKVIENSTYGPLSPVAQYKLGLLLKALTRYQEAQEEFEKVIANYPDSEWAEPAKFQIAVALAKVSPSGKYDESTSLEAKERFQDFVKTHPDAELSEEALQEIERITQKQAENNFNIARFYEKQHGWEAAGIYYNTVIKDFSHTTWAAQALERVKVVEKMIEKTKKKAPLSKEEKEALREEKKQKKEDHVAEIKEKRNSKQQAKLEALVNKKSEKEAKRQEKLEKVKQAKEGKEAKKTAKMQSLDDKKQEKQKAKLGAQEEKKAKAQAKKQEKLEAIEKRKNQKEEKRKAKLELIEKKKQEKKILKEKNIEQNKDKNLSKEDRLKEKLELIEKKKTENQAKRKAKLETIANKKFEKEAKRQEKLEKVKQAKEGKEAKRETLQDEEVIEIPKKEISAPQEDFSVQTKPSNQDIQEKNTEPAQSTSITQEDSVQIESRPESEGQEW